MIQLPPRFVVASQNPDKIREVEAVFTDVGLGDRIVRGLSWPDVAETETTLEGNALLKAHAVSTHTRLAAVADDTGLEVDALDGAPGVHTARFAGPDATYADNVALLLQQMDGVTDRSARFRTVVALATPEGGEVVAHGELAGVIASSPRGTGGFGYDPVFDVDGVTLAEMGETEKNRMSHRARALRALVQMLLTPDAKDPGS